ncbi:MAG TPA: hypothetical protein VFW07_21390 [Parafilimonas sp.]|nr:hypothetical protein [Parafilimonas sp.]
MLAIPEERQHIFNSTAYMIEKKLLDLQSYIKAHSQKLRYVSLEYTSILSEEDMLQIEEEIERMYDLLEGFCNDYGVRKMKTAMQSELMVKANFLWEDLTGAVSLRGYGELDKSIVNDYTNKMNIIIDSVNQLIQQLTKKNHYANNKG